ncbi:MAG: DUF1385 domain-containing protein [Candidatus Cloacimonadaceae bacterium]|jgi:uncharacterized protein YqhQ|nr:DUF1385 domain-containing protein [Candidatus Cloacimonadota bacterium]MCB5258513.1 DUF1385 domain-containing protein [Candidatus Cloacimonadota bacterium]MDD5624146.1 DUF1385 domain-containing protein [Candidatus Cloacimonadota bacterium]MDY0111322.1 DUF1385 domain-containing protein [Candidatus Syntrophosphaera sp.]
MAPKKEISVGGQAVIEGVMMRGPDVIATAIRRKDGTIELFKEHFETKAKKGTFLGLPIIRGFVSLIEMLIIGMKTLTISANRAELDLKSDNPNTNTASKEKSKTAQQLENLLSYVIAFALAFIIFGWLPYWLADIFGLARQNFFFNLFAGIFRAVFFIIYIWLISKMKDIHRIFQYHGAEHKNVNAYEKGIPLEIPQIQANSTIHPRCGTSFIFFVLLLSIIIFALADTIVSAFILHSKIPLATRLAYHIVILLPLVGGVSYEILKFSGKNINHPLVKILTIPGMALQKITTQAPDDSMIEVGLVAMKAALGMDLAGHNVKIIKDVT